MHASFTLGVLVPLPDISGAVVCMCAHMHVCVFEAGSRAAQAGFKFLSLKLLILLVLPSGC